GLDELAGSNCRGKRSVCQPASSLRRTTMRLLLLLSLVLGTLVSMANPLTAAEAVPVFPGAAWATRSPEQVGRDPAKLNARVGVVGGRGCVVRHGYLVYTWGDPAKSSDVASAVKPVLTTLLLMAIQDGKLKSADDRVADFEPRLRDLNGGKDAAMTF